MNSLYSSILHKQVASISRQKMMKNFLIPGLPALTTVPSRTTFILKRKYPPKLNKVGIEARKLKAKDYLYELVEDTDIRPQPLVTVVLKEFVDGYGRKGECVTLKRSVAYNKLLITGLADYATPEIIEKFKSEERVANEQDYSSPWVHRTIKFLENMCLSVLMNKDVDWTLEPWHIKVAFRKAGVVVPEHCIQLPVKPIKGPDLDLESKAFLVTVTINSKDKVAVRCILHHWTANPAERQSFEQPSFPWLPPYRCIFPEDEETISKLPLIKYKSLEQTSQL